MFLLPDDSAGDDAKCWQHGVELTLTLQHDLTLSTTLAARHGVRNRSELTDDHMVEAEPTLLRHTSHVSTLRHSLPLCLLA